VGLVSTIVGHVGDGNFHALILFKTEEEKASAKEVIHRMVKRAIALDGTCSLSLLAVPLLRDDAYGFSLALLGTGEHGVGIGKKEYLVEELGEGTVHLMKTIKKAIDPLGIFNPGKVRIF
jgi:D-lactate dehydrogenase (cytochrome)